MHHDRLLLKAGAIQNLTDARYFSSKAVDMVGFCFDTASPQYINPRDAQQIIGWLEGPKRCGEFGRMDVKAIQEAAMILGLDYVQLIPTGAPQDYANMGVPIILELPANLPLPEIADLAAAWKGQIAYLLLNFHEVALLPQLAQFKDLMEQHAVLLDWPLTSPDIYQEASRNGAVGLNLQGAPETKTGEKSFDDLDAFFALLQQEL